MAERRVAQTAADAAAPAPSPQAAWVIDLEGLDRPGIVREISQVLAERGVNIEELTTDRAEAPMSGELLFRSRARVTVPPGADAAELRARLERLAGDLMVQVTMGEPG